MLYFVVLNFNSINGNFVTFDIFINIFHFSRGLLQIDCLYELFAIYLSRGLFRPRLIFARINGPNDSVSI